VKQIWVVIGIALGLTACTSSTSDTTPSPSQTKEPSGDDTVDAPSRATPSGPGSAGETVPTFARAKCGSLEVGSATASADRSKATPVSPGQLVGARIDPTSTSSSEHYWSAELRAGAYHLVVDSKTATGKVRNIGIEVQRLDARGNEQGTLMRGNEIGRRYRDSGFFEVPSDGVVQFKIRGVFDMEDYVLGIFSNEAPIPSPYFTDCPTITPLDLDKPEAFRLESEGSPGDEQWFSLDLDPGDFSFLLGATQASGKVTNLQYSVDLLDGLGQEDRRRRLMFANEIDTSFQAERMHAVGEKTPFWLRLRNEHEALKMNVTVSKQ